MSLRGDSLKSEGGMIWSLIVIADWSAFQMLMGLICGLNVSGEWFSLPPLTPGNFFPPLTTDASTVFSPTNIGVFYFLPLTLGIFLPPMRVIFLTLALGIFHPLTSGIFLPLTTNSKAFQFSSTNQWFLAYFSHTVQQTAVHFSFYWRPMLGHLFPLNSNIRCTDIVNCCILQYMTYFWPKFFLS